VNAPQSTDRIIYGKLNIDADAKIKGPMTSPTVNGDLRINKVTDFVLVLPQSDPEVVSRDGVVRFVDKIILKIRWLQTLHWIHSTWRN
jgi:hypothetical protein